MKQMTLLLAILCTSSLIYANKQVPDEKHFQFNHYSFINLSDEKKSSVSSRVVFYQDQNNFENILETIRQYVGIFEEHKRNNNPTELTIVLYKMLEKKLSEQGASLMRIDEFYRTYGCEAHSIATEKHDYLIKPLNHIEDEQAHATYNEIIEQYRLTTENEFLWNYLVITFPFVFWGGVLISATMIYKGIQQLHAWYQKQKQEKEIKKAAIFI